MEQLGKANTVRLRSREGAYVVAHDDKATVGESDDWSSPNAKWVVESVEGKPNVIRLKSCLGLYLTPSDGKVDWELIRDDGVQVKLKSWGDRLLQADSAAQNRTFNFMRWVGELLQGCCQPNSISHHDPTQNWVFWHVEDGAVAKNPFSSAMKDFLRSELYVQLGNNIMVPPPAPEALPLLRNATARGTLDSGRMGCREPSNAFAQANRGIGLDEEEEASDSDESNASGQADRGIGLDAEEASDSEESNDFGQTNGSP